MVTIKGQIKLVDFGLSFSEKETIHFPRNMVGSPFWIAPEVVRKEPHGKPLDIWSLAICCLEMFNQRCPFSGSEKPKNKKKSNHGESEDEETIGQEDRLVYYLFRIARNGFDIHFKNEIQFEKPNYSTDFRAFLEQCLEGDPTKRARAADLLRHPFTQTALPKQAMKKLFLQIFHLQIFSQIE